MIREGEREHDHRVLTTTIANDIKFAAQRYASTYWGEGERERFGNSKTNYWYAHGGEIAIRVTHVVEVSKYEYQLMSRIFQGQKAPPDYFKIKQSGFDTVIQREQIEIDAGKYGKIHIFQDDGKLGFIVDVFDAEDECAGTMPIWEDDLYDEDRENDLSMCLASGEHLKSCDDDGFCNNCGHQ